MQVCAFVVEAERIGDRVEDGGRHVGARPCSSPRVVLVEEWVDADALEYHFSLPHFARMAAVLEEILAEPFTLRRLTDAQPAVN